MLLFGGTCQVFNNPADVLSIVLRGTLGRSRFGGPQGGGPRPPRPPPVPPVPPVPGAFDAAFDPVARVIRLAVSAARADGALSDDERALIMERAKEAGVAW